MDMSLAAVIKDKLLNPTEMGCIIIQVLSGLDFLHGLNLVHRDLKPANILLKNKAGKIGDFGGLKFYDAIVTQTRIGTEIYQAPELLREEAASPQSDIYAVALLFAELLNGAPVYDPKRSPFVICQQTMNASSRVPPLNASRALTALLPRMWAAEKGERPAARDCLKALDDEVVAGADRMIIKRAKNPPCAECVKLGAEFVALKAENARVKKQADVAMTANTEKDKKIAALEKANKELERANKESVGNLRRFTPS
jgi:serine/threonine protein kinase